MLLIPNCTQNHAIPSTWVVTEVHKSWLILYNSNLWCSPAGDASAQFTAAPPTCPGNTFSLGCTVSGDRNGITIWKVNGGSECTLPHSTAGASSTCGNSSTFTATFGLEFGTSATSFSSTLSGTATSELNGTLVECFGPHLDREPGNRVGNSTLQILGEYIFVHYLSLANTCKWGYGHYSNTT